jgi:hypothetical protein
MSSIFSFGVSSYVISGASAGAAIGGGLGATSGSIPGNTSSSGKAAISGAVSGAVLGGTSGYAAVIPEGVSIGGAVSEATSRIDYATLLKASSRPETVEILRKSRVLSTVSSATLRGNPGNAQNTDSWNEFVNVSDLNAIPGDLIEFKRGYYDHWGVNLGGGYIIDLVNLGHGKGLVLREKLDLVAENGMCRVNNLIEAALRRELKPKERNKILKTAFDKLDNEMAYDILNYNCQHFATQCFYGVAFSEHIENEEHI